MKLSDQNVNIEGLHPVMRKALKRAERLWKEEGREEGITITCGLNGVHSAGSWHYCGAAVDLRTRYWDEAKQVRVHAELKRRLPDYDVVFHGSHIHLEPSDKLAEAWGLMV